MAEELLIQVTDFESRVALVKDGAVHEVHIARSSGYSVTGNIYLGKVVRIVPGMQAAFIDIGLERPGFLHASDVQTPLISTGPWPRSIWCSLPPVNKWRCLSGLKTTENVNDCSHFCAPWSRLVGLGL